MPIAEQTRYDDGQSRFNHDALALPRGSIRGRRTPSSLLSSGDFRAFATCITVFLSPKGARPLSEPLQKRRNARLPFQVAFRKVHQHANPSLSLKLLRARPERPRHRRAAEQRDELAPLHVWMAPAWQEKIERAAQKSLAVMCPACSRSPDGLLALMGSANRGLITRTGSMSQ